MQQLIKTNNQVSKSEKWLQKFKDLQVVKFSDCFPSTENLTIRQISKLNDGKGLTDLKQLLYDVWVAFLLELNVTNTMQPFQLQNLVNDICEFYSHLTIRDVKLFINQVKLGAFGKNFNRIDCMVIFEYLAIYDNWRIAEIEKDNENYKSVDRVSSYHPDVLKVIGKIFKQTQKEIEKPREPTQAEINQQEFYLKVHKDFCDLHFQQGNEQGTQYVNYKGKMMTFSEYYSAIFIEMQTVEIIDNE